MQFETSPQTDKIVPDFINAVANMPAIEKTGYNPHFGNRHVELDHLIDVVKTHLYQYGAMVAIQPCYDAGPGQVGIKTVILHGSGQWIASSLNMPIEDVPVYDKAKNCVGMTKHPQAAGQAITYGRRYALQDILGISAETDNDHSHSNMDGNGGQQQRQAPQSRPPAQQGQGRPQGQGSPQRQQGVAGVKKMFPQGKHTSQHVITGIDKKGNYPDERSGSTKDLYIINTQDGREMAFYEVLGNTADQEVREDLERFSGSGELVNIDHFTSDRGKTYINDVAPAQPAGDMPPDDEVPW